jgi:hypothetical protein
MDRQRKLAALVRALGSPSSESHAKAEVAFVCPQPECRKDRKKLAVNVESDVFHCWICGFAGRSLVPLLRFGRREDLEEYYASKERRADGEQPKRKEVPALPAEFEPLWKPSLGPIRASVTSYLSSRRVTMDDVVRMRLGFCESGTLGMRVVFPSYDSDGLNFVIGRAFNSALPKYLNGGDYEKDIVFNERLIDWKSPITLVEGPFDSLAAGWNSIPLLGKTILPALKRKIVMSGSDVFVALDLDAKRDGMQLVGDLVSHGLRCFFVPMGRHKDVGEMTREELAEAKRMATMVDDDLSFIRASL